MFASLRGLLTSSKSGRDTWREKRVQSDLFSALQKQYYCEHFRSDSIIERADNGDMAKTFRRRALYLHRRMSKQPASMGACHTACKSAQYSVHSSLSRP